MLEIVSMWLITLDTSVVLGNYIEFVIFIFLLNQLPPNQLSPAFSQWGCFLSSVIIFVVFFFFRDKQLMEYSKLYLWSNAQSFGDSLMPSLGSGFLPFHNRIYDIVPRTQQKLILSEKKTQDMIVIHLPFWNIE